MRGFTMGIRLSKTNTQHTWLRYIPTRRVFGLIWCMCAVGCHTDPFPRWAWEHWVWEDESTQESATALVGGYQERGIPVAAIIIDSPWATGYNTFTWDTSLFPNPQGFIDDMHTKDVRVILWVVPAINEDVPDLYAYAKEKNYFMQVSANNATTSFNWWKGDGALIDLFNPEALAWWHSLLDPILAMGIDGWKCDGLDFHTLTHGYSPYLKSQVERSDYSNLYYRDFLEYTRLKLDDDRINMVRPVDNYGVIGLGGDDYAFAPVDMTVVGWVGDQDASFIGLRNALDNMLQSTLLGYVGLGSDIGGYRQDKEIEGGRDRLVFLRWAQLAAFNPVMENGGKGKHEPWFWGDDTTRIYRQFVKLHHALLSYLMKHAKHAFDTNTSLMTFSEAGADEATTYSFTLGPDIFVQPVLNESNTQNIQFPVAQEEGAQETWVYLFDNTNIYTSGQSITLTLTESTFPVFVRQGAGVLEDLKKVLKD
jgi:alpha-D-xyloside xylohydrolase